MDDICTGNNIQYRVVTGGNPELDAENSESFYYEISYQPPCIKGFTATLGYTHINVKDVITAPNPATIVNNPGQYPPGSVIRDPGQGVFPGDPGPIIAINNTLLNLDEQKVDSFDLELNYVKETDALGTFTSDLLASYTPNFQQSGENGGFFQKSGEGDQGPNVRGNFSIFWRGPKGCWADKLEFGPTVNYWSQYHEVLYPPRNVREWITVDLQATYEAPWDTTLTVGCNNIVDRDAPRALGQNGEGYDNTVHDNRGRFIYFRVGKKF
jgi:outer membrane receptor protein involved in Fe transport